jgi:MOSC domain-containing protein YiiM
MSELDARVVSVHSGDHEDLHKDAFETVEIDFEGFPGDGHRGFTRVTWQGDKDPEGTVRRNERQWSGVSIEELTIITERMDLARPLEASTLGANLCVEGIPDFSELPRGTRLILPSGVVLLVEETNPPCKDMGMQIAAAYKTTSGEPADYKLFPKHSIGLRGVVGVVDVPGLIRAGDRVVVEIPKSTFRPATEGP